MRFGTAVAVPPETPAPVPPPVEFDKVVAVPLVPSAPTPVFPMPPMKPLLLATPGFSPD
jgi:hypothetical protein